MTDTERLSWLEEKAYGAALISDDNGHWTVSFDGFQNVSAGPDPIDIETTFFVEKDKWHDNVRAAIDAAMQEEE